MTETLKKVTNGEISIPELLEWLCPETLQKCFDSRFTELKADFAISFINHIRDCNAWLVPSSCKPVFNSDFLSSTTVNIHHNSQKNIVPKLPVKKLSNVQDIGPKNNLNCRKKERTVSVTVGCESYQNVRRNRGKTVNHKAGLQEGTNRKNFTVQNSNLLNFNDYDDDFPKIENNLLHRRLKSVPSNLEHQSTKDLSKKVQKKIEKLSSSCRLLNPSVNLYERSDKVSDKENQNSRKNTPDPFAHNTNISESFDVVNDNFPKLSDNSLLQRRIEPVSLQLKSVTIQPFPQPSLKDGSDNLISCYTVPSPTSLHNEQKLYLYEKIYNILFSYGLLPNIYSELYFLIQLLTSSVKMHINSDHILSTVHNCVHFSITCLYEQSCLLILFDKATLQLLCDIPYLKSFSPQLVHFISTHLKEKTVIRTKKKSFIEGVPFSEDSDTRSNFPSEESFRSFSKQRNLFCDILGMWNNAKEHSAFNASFEMKFLEKVRLLIDLGVENYNYYHLAQLFHKQLKVSCLHAAETLDGYETNTSKYAYKNLQSLKLFQKLSIFIQGDGSCLPNVNDPQIFFEAFLIAASSVHLNNYVLDLFTCEIIELNNPDNFSEIHERSIAEIREKFSTTLHTLRLLAKFYAFINFMPYKSSKPLPKRLAIDQKETRKHTKPLLDLEKILNVAIKKQCLVITIPWVVQYLHMMDQVAPTLDPYFDICKLLAKIYRGYFRKHIIPINFEFIRLIIGSLIDSSNFPLECLFYNYEFPIEDDVEILDHHLDFQNVVDKQLVYSCCPKLAELKLLIDNFLCGTKIDNQEMNKISSKLSTLWRNTEELSAEQNLEIQMEENFFFSHSVILKQTVDFVAERVTSRIIHEIHTKIDSLKAEAVTEISVDCKKQNKKDLCSIYPLIALESEKLCKDARTWVAKLIKKQKLARSCVTLSEVKLVLPQLLSEDVDAEVVNISSKIASRMVIKKVTDWMDSNVIPEKVISNLKNKVQKLLNDDNPPTIFDEEDIPSLECMAIRLPFNYLRDLQKIALELESDYHTFSIKTLLDLYDEISVAIQKNYLPFYVIQAVTWLATNITMTLIANFPKVLTLEVINKIVNFFISCPSNIISPSCFLNCEVLFIMSLQRNHLEESWCHLASLFDIAITLGLFTLEGFTECMTSLQNYPWTQKQLCLFNTYVRPIILVSLEENGLILLNSDFKD